MLIGRLNDMSATTEIMQTLFSFLSTRFLGVINERRSLDVTMGELRSLTKLLGVRNDGFPRV